MSSNLEEFINVPQENEDFDYSEIVKKKFETLQKEQQCDEIKLNQQKSMDEKYKLIDNEMRNLKKENEELKKQIETKSEESAETCAIRRGRIKDIWKAIGVGSLNAVKFYYKYNPENIFKTHPDKCTPLHFASKLGHLHIIEFLISKGAEIDQTNFAGDTPLMWATKWHKLPVVNYLLDKGAKINHENNYKITALSIAIEEASFDIVELLIDRGADIKGALHTASSNGDCFNVEILLSRGADIEERDSQGSTPLMRAVKMDHFGVVEILIKHGANKAGTLQLASRNGWDILNFLLSKGADVDERDSEGFTPLMRAVEKNDFDSAVLLVDKGANKVGALHIASRNGYVEMIRFLLFREAEIDERDSRGFTPLMCAVERDHLGIVELLIGKGANKAGALDIASRKGVTYTLEFLLQIEGEVLGHDSEAFTAMCQMYNVDPARCFSFNDFNKIMNKSNPTSVIWQKLQSFISAILLIFLSIIICEQFRSAPQAASRDGQKFGS